MARSWRVMATTDRERIILEHYPLVRAIAGRMVRRFPSNVDVDDLINIGTVGLIEALDRFDPSRGVPFRAYAEMRVRGAIVDALRASDWVPRSVRRKSMKLETARTRLRTHLGRDPDRAELARELEMSVEDLDDLVGGSAIRRLVSLDGPVDDEGGLTIGDQVGSDDPTIDDRWILRETTEEVQRAVTRLPEREQQVIILYYLRGMQLKEIGALLGVTESRVCQLCKQAVKRLQGFLGDEVWS